MWGDEGAQEVAELLLATKQGDINKVASLLQEDGDGILVDASNKTGDRPLILAAWHGRLNIVRLLIDQGADVDASNADGNNALHCAAYRGFPDIAAHLLAYGAAVDVLDGLTGKTALIKAAYAGRAGIVQQLLRHGADTAVEDRQGYTALGGQQSFPTLSLTPPAASRRSNGSWRDARLAQHSPPPSSTSIVSGFCLRPGEHGLI